ncbi:hypothetical protein [Alcanivorax sp. DP30]|uniref:hypothetical protein n=1 Tax=Alcanivorax sp. DP30 TaxID=2606217 RepID=UPI00136E2E60|nr:hypothetical protein [Alcanivorax sp. DP30]MZR62275.1 hypothetical protein [Alcanivorax sp. DP30]
MVRIFYKAGKSSSQALKPLFFMVIKKNVPVRALFATGLPAGMARSQWNRYTVAPFSTARLSGGANDSGNGAVPPEIRTDI